VKKLRYSVACSLDGYIAGPNGEIDWIVMDPAIDFTSIISQFDTVLMVRRTYEHMLAAGQGTMPGMTTIVASSTLDHKVHAGVTVLSSDLEQKVRDLKTEAGKDRWLFGRGLLASRLIEADLVNTVEVTMMPTLPGRGTPLFQGSMKSLALKAHQAYETGIMALKYECSGS
jgi:dihydrofolate reductase